MPTLDDYISLRRWATAIKELIRAIDEDVLDVRNYNLWGRYAGQIEAGLRRRWNPRRQFWLTLHQAIVRAERRRGVQTHKGLVSFKIGVMNLVSGKSSFATSIRWLHRAYQEDIPTYRKMHQEPTQQSAYRMLVIVRAFESFRRRIRDMNTKHFIEQLVSSYRGRIGLVIAAVYDTSIIPRLMLTRLHESYFDRLLGRNPYRPLVEQNYRGAEWLMAHRPTLGLRETDIETYGLAQAVVVLCGTTIEGILLKKLHRKDRRSRNLSSLTMQYLKKLHRAPELASGLLFLWFSRDLIHPDVARRQQVIVDLNFAQYTVELTKHVLVLLSKRSRRRGASPMHSP